MLIIRTLPWYWCDEKDTLPLKVLVPKTHHQTLTVRITSNKFRNGNILQNTHPVPLKTVKVIKASKVWETRIRVIRKSRSSGEEDLQEQKELGWAKEWGKMGTEIGHCERGSQLERSWSCWQLRGDICGWSPRPPAVCWPHPGAGDPMGALPPGITSTYISIQRREYQHLQYLFLSKEETVLMAHWTIHCSENRATLIGCD